MIFRRFPVLRKLPRCAKLCQKIVPATLIATVAGIAAWTLIGQSVVLGQHGDFKLTIVDEDTKRPLDCRLEIRNEKGVTKKVEGLPFWYDSNAVAGSVQISFPLGTYPITVERGLEYLPRTGHFVLNRGAKDAKMETLRRFANLAEKGWWSGDLSVFRPQKDIEFLMRADDVHFVPLLTSGAKRDFDEKWFDSDRLYTTRNWDLRHPDCAVGIFNLSGELNFPELALEEKTSPIPFLYQLRKVDEAVWFDVTDAESWDLPLLVALGLVDSYQILGPHLLREQILPRNVCWDKIPTVKTFAKLKPERFVELPPEGTQSPSECGFEKDIDPVRYRGALGRQRWTEDVYFHLLNTGHKIPPTAGSGSGKSPNPVGSNRVYVYVDREDFLRFADTEGLQLEGANAGFNREMWWTALRNNMAVVTNGPILQPWVDGELPGFFFEFEDERPVKLEISMSLATRAPIQYIDVIVNGKVQESIPFRDYAEAGQLPPLEIRESGWFVLRVVADTSQAYCCAMTAPFFVQLGEQSPLRVKSAAFFLAWEVERVRRLRESGAFEGKEGERLEKFHNYALKYWQSILKKAKTL